MQTIFICKKANSNTNHYNNKSNIKEENEQSYVWSNVCYLSR